jgi:hypothetical protein
MADYDVADAANHLSDLVDKVLNGEQIIFRKGNEKFQIVHITGAVVRDPGSGGNGWLSSDFDEPLELMEDYM